MAQDDEILTNDNAPQTTYLLAVDAYLQSLATRCCWLISMTGQDPTPELVDTALEGTPIAITADGRKRVIDMVMAMDGLLGRMQKDSPRLT